MNQVQVNSLRPEQRSLVAVAYLMSEKKERPEGTEGLFEKLERYDAQASALSEEIRKAQKFISDSKSKLQQLIGSINTTSEIISEKLPEDKVEEWCLAYKMPDGIQAAASSTISELKMDMAGATARTIKPVDVDALSKGK